MQMGIDPVTHKAATAHDLGLLDVSGTDVKPLLSATLSHMSQWDRVRAETEARLSSNINSSNNLSSFNKSSLSQVMSSSNFDMAPSSEMKFCSSSSSSAGDVFNRSWKTQVTDMLRESFELAAARLNPLMDQSNYQKVLQEWETSSLQQQCQNSLGGQGDLMYDPESSANSASSLSLQEHHHHSPSAGHGGSCTPISSSSPTNNNIFMAMSPTSTLSPLEHFLQPPPLRLPFSEFSLPCQPSTSEEGSALAFNTCSSDSHASDSKLEEFWQSTQQAGDLQIAATTVSSTANFELREPGLLPPDFFLDSGASVHGALVMQEILSSSSCSTSFVVDNILTENLQDFQQTFQSCRVQTANVGASHCAPFITPVGRI